MAHCVPSRSDLQTTIRLESFTYASQSRPLTFATERMLGFALSPRFCTACWWVALAETPQSRRINRVLVVLRMVGVLVTSVAFFQVGPWRQLCWLAPAALPTAVLYGSLLNRQLVWQLLTDFEALYILLNVVVLVVCAALEFDGDDRVIGIACLVPSFLLIALTDALPPGAIRKKASVRFYVVNVAFLTVLFAQFCTGHGFDDDPLMIELTPSLELYRHRVGDIRRPSQLSFSVKGVAWRACSTLLIFGLRNLRSRVLHPDCLVILKSRIETRATGPAAREQALQPAGAKARVAPTDF